MYRIHIDIPVPVGEAEAVAITNAVVEALQQSALVCQLQSSGVEEINYRLGHDEDRQRSNYLQKTPSGHVTCKKNRIALDTIGETP